MICLFEIAGQMNPEDDPMLKILSAALLNLSNYNVKVSAGSLVFLKGTWRQGNQKLIQYGPSFFISFFVFNPFLNSFMI